MTSATYRKADLLGDPAMPPLTLLRSHRDGAALLEQWIRSHAGPSALRILEAGCGNKWPINLDNVDYTLTGVDLDEHAVAIRKRSVREVDEMIVGDLRQTRLLPAGQFDVIYNSFVLEHVQGAEQVLDNFMQWLAPGGLLILRIPDRDSVYGFLTRTTPFWFHVLYKKYVQGVRNAGKPGYDPYPTFHEPVISRRGIHTYCRRRGCVIKSETGFAGYLPPHGLLGGLLRAGVIAISALSLGRLKWRYNNLTFVIEKPMSASPEWAAGPSQVLGTLAPAITSQRSTPLAAGMRRAR